MSVRYKISSEVATRTVRTPHTTWEMLRYQLEKLHLGAPRRHLWCFFIANWASDVTGCKPNWSKSVRGRDRIDRGDTLVLFRKQYPAALARCEHIRGGVYVPVGARGGDVLVGRNTEDSKILAIMTSGVGLPGGRGDLQHPAEYTYRGQTPVPNGEYVCRGCGSAGSHFRADCPSGEDETSGLVLDRVRVAHGIPRSMLKPASADDVRRGNVMKGKDGEYLVRVTPTPKHQPKTRADARPCATSSTRFDFEDWLDGMDAAAPPARRVHMTTCTHWLRGLCVKGDQCEFLHNASPEYMPECKFYADGRCEDGTCPFRHVTRAPPVSMCADYVRGFCPLGPACPRAHLKRVTPVAQDWETCDIHRDAFNSALSFI